ncbi:hypothetical protein F5Y08DRAFT_282194 [Xylaria arbuscula]|nr:hypothetical protein F5Y08DRAFT_282194 [Xylaria arbuscula]
MLRLRTASSCNFISQGRDVPCRRRFERFQIVGSQRWVYMPHGRNARPRQSQFVRWIGRLSAVVNLVCLSVATGRMRGEDRTEMEASNSKSLIELAAVIVALVHLTHLFSVGGLARSGTVTGHWRDLNSSS